MVDLDFLPVLRDSMAGYPHGIDADEELGKAIGSGSYAMVYAHPTDKKLCVKITRKDEAWLTYADYCINNPENPFCLDIHYVEQTQHHIIAVMERLDRTVMKVLKDADDDTEESEIISTMLSIYTDGYQTYDMFTIDEEQFLLDISDNVGFDDIHEENVMIDTNGKLRIIDPVTGDNDFTDYYYNRNDEQERIAA